MRSALQQFRRFYGASPLHLLSMLACFTLLAYVFALTRDDSTAPRMAIWFLGVVLVHDLVLLPSYTAVDRAFGWILRKLPKGSSERRTLPIVNYVRIPTLAAGLLLLIFLPGISKQRPQIVISATGLNQDPYLGRWLVLTAAFFFSSAVLYAVRGLLHGFARSRTSGDKDPPRRVSQK